MSRLVAACWFLLIAGTGALRGQEIVYTMSFTEALQAQNLEYYEPVEQWLHVAGERHDQFMTYDLILENDRNDLEIRFRLRPAAESELLPPNVEITRLLASISTNSEVSEIHMSIANPEYAKSEFNAESVIFASFTPKPEFSRRPLGSLVSIASGEYGAVDVIILHYDETYSVEDSFRNIRFKEKSPGRSNIRNQH